MTFQFIKQSFEKGVATITLARADKRNALTQELLHELHDSIHTLNARPDLRLLVLTAEGSVFCAGMDLSQMLSRADRPDAHELWQRDTELYRDVVWALFSSPVPTLAVLPGPALAGGVGLVLACNLVLASETAWFALPEPQRGITAAVVAPLLLHRLGARWSDFLLLSGQSITAAEGERIGICHRIVPESELQTTASEWQQSILMGGPSALRQTKALMHDITREQLWHQLGLGMKVSAAARETEEAKEGLSAFREKRPPSWQT